MGGSGTISLVTSLFGNQTVTRAELRRAICQELHMPFIRRTNGYSLVGASPTTLTITDANLRQEEDDWKGQWWYSIKNDEVRKIVSFSAASDTIKLEYPATLPSVNDQYEIHSVWNAYELHGAINRAIDDAFPAFFDYVSDSTLVLQENTLKYDISQLSSSVWKVAKVWLEHSETSINGTASATSTVNALIDTASPFSNVEAGWLMSIYAGTGAGQLRIVGTPTSSNLAPTVAWATAPDSTSKYMVWDPDSQTIQWEQALHATFDAKEYPSYLYFTKSFPNSVGLRIRIEYMARPLELTADASTTVVPKEFIINKALSILFGQKVNDNRADRNRYANLEEYRRQLAEQYRVARAYPQPDITVWQSGKTLLARNYSGIVENPF